MNTKPKLKYSFSRAGIVFTYIPCVEWLDKPILILDEHSEYKPNMDLKTLKYFISVYDTESFSSAAKSCYVAQPSISSAIAQLEQQLNVKLFTRHARGVQPTEQGNKLYPLAKKLTGQADAIKQTFNIDSNKQEFNLGVTKGLGVSRMSLLLKELTTAQPHLALTLVPPNEPSNAKIVTKDELNPQDNYMPIWQEDYLLAMPYHHVLSLKETIQLNDFEGLAMIQRSPCHAWRSLEDTLAIAGISLDVRAKIQTIEYALGLVSADLGCALVPAYPEVLEHNSIVFRPIDDVQLRREIVLAYQQDSPTVNALKEIVSRYKNE